MDRLAAAFDAIDAANADDPNTIVVRGATRPKEQAHAELMTEWVERLRPDASEALRLAARAHHLRRWAVPRADYPEGRAGYLRWRKELHRRHADDVGRILGDAGYDDATVARVQALVAKKDQPARAVSDDPDMRALEDALCLVFVETQFADLADRLDDDEKMVEVVRKTWAKMSPEGQALALTLPLRPADAALVQRALGAAPA